MGRLACCFPHAILAAVKLANGDVLRAAKLLAISKTTMYRKLQSYKGNVGEMTTEQPIARVGPESSKLQKSLV
ncbi:MAG TPA: helix-turn-helix domain-containing protein [Terriglobales bacterium]|nr:helix-turn-helix domain-containing protein [Terriglobales bacterium]